MNTDVDMGFIPIVHPPQRKIPAKINFSAGYLNFSEFD
jgi:hypothetical protein